MHNHENIFPMSFCACVNIYSSGLVVRSKFHHLAEQCLAYINLVCYNGIYTAEYKFVFQSCLLRAFLRRLFIKMLM